MNTNSTGSTPRSEPIAPAMPTRAPVVEPAKMPAHAPVVPADKTPKQTS